MKKIFILFNHLKAQGLILGFMLFTGLSAFGQTYAAPGTYTWTPTTSGDVKVECWGGGGAGGAATNSAGRAGGGGGGGSYTSSTISVTAGVTYTITVGEGGSLGPTTAPTFGGKGGASEFALNGSPLVRASGGTGGGGATPPATSGAGGVLGGVYDFVITNPGTGYTTNPTVAIASSNGEGTGATAGAARTDGVTYITSRVQGTTPYTAIPTVTITGGNGSGATATAVVNLSVDLGTTIMPSISGSAGVVNVGSGAGGAGANGGGAGGASITVQGNIGIDGTAPGGGGSGGFSAGSPTGAKNGGLGAPGQVKLTVLTVPVELTSFQVKNNQKTASLAWATASEKENAFFDIQQSANGTDFQTIGQVKGHGTTAVSNTYNFEHTTPSVGVNYYRLKQVDFNGATTLSGVRAVVFGKKGLVVKTTLVTDALDIMVSDETPTMIQIVNTAGQTVLVRKVQGAQRLDVSALPIGHYIIRAETGDIARFVKQ